MAKVAFRLRNTADPAENRQKAAAPCDGVLASAMPASPTAPTSAAAHWKGFRVPRRSDQRPAISATGSGSR